MRSTAPADGGEGSLTLDEAARTLAAVLDAVEEVVVGDRRRLATILYAVLADGHVLIEDYPGLAKTLTARAFADALALRFTRVQFTPDLTPLDITGSSVFRQTTGEFDFRPGPVFTHLLLADEVNRAPAKTQAALLEAMQERQVTVDGVTHRLSGPFCVLATQNPIDHEGTYALPEAQLDRFLVRTTLGYPGREGEWEVLARRLRRGREEVTARAVTDAAGLRALQRTVESVHVEQDVGYYIVDLVTATRRHSAVRVGASPRGSLAVLKLTRARALAQGRDYVTPDDVKAVAVPALGHRLVLRPELWMQDASGDDIVRECLAAVAAPVPDAVAGPERPQNP